VRKLVVDGQVFRYMVGYSNVRIVGPGGFVLTPACHEIKGCSPETFEQGQWKKTLDGQILPREIAAWIKKQSEGPAALKSVRSRS
jgi:hypothetical protein